MPDRADLLRRIDKALATPPQRMSAAYALGLLRETRDALAPPEGAVELRADPAIPPGEIWLMVDGQVRFKVVEIHD